MIEFCQQPYVWCFLLRYGVINRGVFRFLFLVFVLKSSNFLGLCPFHLHFKIYFSKSCVEFINIAGLIVMSSFSFLVLVSAFISLTRSFLIALIFTKNQLSAFLILCCMFWTLLLSLLFPSFYFICISIAVIPPVQLYVCLADQYLYNNNLYLHLISFYMKSSLPVSIKYFLSFILVSSWPAGYLEVYLLISKYGFSY